ncbi:MAG: ABC transporter ATP-binding protein [Anaerolineae bacterium]|nr:MAG: ABC transporter ATP-binding protein [Anaerolineae bacterium]
MFDGSGWWRYISYDEKQKPQVDRALLRRSFKYARPYVKSIAIVLSAILFTSVIELVPPLLYRDLFDNVIPNRDFSRLNLLALGMVGIPILSNLVGVVERLFSARMGEGIIYDLRNALFEHLQKMGLRFFTHTKRGEIISRLNNDVVGAQSAVTDTIPSIVTNTVTLLTTLVVMLSLEWRLTLLSIAILPLFIWPAKRVGRILREIRRKALDYNAEMNNIVSETLTINGALLVKTFGRQKREEGRYRETSRNVADIGVRRAMIGRWFFMGLGIASTLGMALNYWLGGFYTLTGAISAGTIVAFVAYLARLYGPISSLTNVQVEFVTSLVSFERVFEYLDLPVEIEDKPDAIVLDHVRGEIRFENVTFDYSEANERLGIKVKPPKPAGEREAGSENGHSEAEEGGMPFILPSRRFALEDVSFTIPAGSLTALVGPSGAGKTSMTYLLPRLYDPTSGRITIDGHDLRDVAQESLARQIGMVTQETYLFHDSIRANLLYARPEATEAELVAAAKAANIYDFVRGLPDGFDTRVGERGYRLSGGEKQRLAIARVVLKDPRILILDEATSHLDSQNEALIQAALEPLMAGRTSIVIAHRLSTILAANQILAMGEGRLVEHGTHAELVAHGGLYASLYETQFRPQPEAA